MPAATKARVFQSGNSQAVRLPKEFRFRSSVVEIFRRGFVAQAQANGAQRQGPGDPHGGEHVGGLHRAGGAGGATGRCHSGQVELSPVLKAMGVPPEIGLGAVRFSLGTQNTPQQVENFLRVLEGALARFKRLTAIAV